MSKVNKKTVSAIDGGAQNAIPPPSASAGHGTGELFAEYADVITVMELAKMLRIGRNSAYDLVKNGDVQSVRIGNKIRIAKSSVVKFLALSSKIGSI
jgi:excisionase family DNA binding protein